MTTRSQPLLTGLSRCVQLLSLALLPTLITEGGPPIGSHRSPVNGPISAKRGSAPLPYPAPYLAVVGPAPMRFREPPAPPSFELEPVAAGPAHLEPDPPPPVLPPVKEKTDPAVPVAIPPKPSLGPSPSPEKKPDEPDSVPILPDDTRREVRPEDLLPFFQFPRNGGTTLGVRVPVPPAPSAPALPPSSATYRQQ